MGCKGRISLNLECLWRCLIIGLPLSFAMSLLSCLLLLPKAPGNAIGFNGHVPGKVALKILDEITHGSTSPCIDIDAWVAPADLLITLVVIIVSSLYWPALPTM